MINITFDKYSGKWYMHLSDSNVVALTFEQVEELSECLRAIVTDEYSKALSLDLEGGEDCEGGACKI